MAKLNSKSSWGGSWTEQKLEAFSSYVEAYLTIMHATRKKCNGWPEKIIYFDGFAGSGSRNSESSTKSMQQTLLDLNISNEDNNIYKGSAERVLQLCKKFDEYIFVDDDKDSLEQLKNTLNKKQLITNKCCFIEGNVNEILPKYLKNWNSQTVALVFLDPFGMQVEWNTIESMKEKRIDLWILLPSGVIINRLLDKEGKLQSKELLIKHLGMSESGITSAFYRKEQQINLFGEQETVISKRTNAIKKISELYIEKLKTIFKHVTKPPLELKNSKNVAIFHLIFSSNNESAKKIASQIIEKKQK